MAGRVLGDALVVINPDTTGFRQLADVQLRKQLAGFRPNVMLGIDAKEANLALTGIQARIKAMSGRLTELRIGADGKQAEAAITKIQARLALVASQMASLTMGADTKKIDAAIAKEQAGIARLKQQMSKLSLDADDAKAAARIANLEARAAHLRKDLKDMPAGVDIRKAAANIVAIEAELKVLRANANAVRIAADRKSFTAQIAASEAEVRRLKQEASDIRLGANVNMGKLLTAEATLLEIEHTVSTLPVAAATGDVALGVLGKALVGTGTGWGFLTRSVVLFGGAFNRVLPVVLASVAVWHVVADAVIELGAVWIPAGLAVGAFAIAASDAAVTIQRRMQAVHTVMDATGQAVPPLTNKLEQLHKAVQPQVYQLFGDALTIMNSRAGTFQQVAKATGTVLDQLGARIVYAVTANNKLGNSTNQLSGFWKTAISDVSKLGDSIGNVFGIFGNFFKAIPGFAAGLLTIGDDFTKILETASAAAVPVLKWILLLHGYILYTGLAVTATLAFIGGMANLAKQFFTFAAGSVAAGIGALKSFGLLLASVGEALLVYVTNIVIAGSASGAFAAALAPLAANPMLWVAAAAIALGALVVAIGRSKDAAQQFNDTMQQTIANAQLSNVVTVIQKAQAQTAARLADSTVKLNQAIAEQGNRTGQASRSWGLETAAVYNASKAHQELVSGLGKLDSQQQLVTSRFSDLTRKYGSGTAALGLLNAAGITGAQITATQGHAWAEALIQIDSTVQAYTAMGTQAGTLGNDLDVLGRTLTDQYKAVQTLNQGWSAFISDVTGTQGSFDTVAQGFATLNDHSGTLRLTLGKLKVAYKDANVAIDSLTPAGIALNQAFGDQVVNVDKLFASWRTAGLAGNLFTAGVKDAIGPLVKYAAGSREATAQLVALAQEAGYQGPISMAALTKWLGNTHNATQKLKDITNQATAQEALLTGAMQAQGSFIANKLIADINNAILKYNGVEKAATAYGNAVARSGAQSDAARGARGRLITDLIKSGQAAHDSTGSIAAMISKVLGIPPKEALQIVMTGTGSFSLSQINAKTGKQQQAARGLFVTGGTPGQDSVSAMLMPGEVVVPTSMVRAGAVDHLRGMLPGFAGGGLVKTGNLDVLSGQYAVNEHNAFKNSMTRSMVSMMRGSLKAAEAAATAAAAASAGGTGVAGPGGGAPAANAALARRMMPSWGSGAEWAAWNTLMMHESGWNQFARNPSSGAYGIPQALPPGKMGAAANPPQSNPAAQISWMIGYIRSAYGDPIRAWAQYYAHPGGVGYYAKGGLVRKMAAGGAVRRMATGGQIPLGKYLPQLRAAQGQEYHDYLGLRQSYLGDLSRAKKGSWTSGHRAGIRSELGTLAKVQSLEEAAYDNILHHGTAKANLSRFGTRIRAVAGTSRDKDLAHSHPGFTHSLQYWLGVLTHLSQANVAPVYGGTQAKLQFPAWLGKARTAQAGETYDYRGLEDSFRTGLAHAKKGTWLYANRKGLGERLYAVAVKQNAEAAAYADLVKHSTGSVADLAGLAGRISKLGNQARSESGALQPSLLGHLPGGHPGWVKALQAQLKALTSLSANPPFNPPWAPGNLGPSHTAAGGVLTFDRGGLLPPGLHMTWNGTGRAEKITPAMAGPSEIHLHVQNSGVIGSQQQTDAWLQNSLNRLARTGYLTQAASRATGH